MKAPAQARASKGKACLDEMPFGSACKSQCSGCVHVPSGFQPSLIHSGKGEERRGEERRGKGKGKGKEKERRGKGEVKER